MGRVLPILFNGSMVRDILDGRKTVTRRAVKYKYDNTEMKMRTDKYGTRLIEIQRDIEGETHGKNPDGSTWRKLLPYIEKNPPYKKGDVLYVRETWAFIPCVDCNMGYSYPMECHEEPATYENRYSISEGCFIYREDFPEQDRKRICWSPSIHMPKQAARIWLKVTGVRVEQLHDIKNFQAEGIKLSEGCEECLAVCGECNSDESPVGCDNEIEKFAELWDATVRKADIDRYGWDANPWVWVIEFERCGKPEEGT